MRVRKLSQMPYQRRCVVEQLGGSRNVDDHIVPGGNHLAVLALGGIPVGRDVVIRAGEDYQHSSTRHQPLPLRIGTGHMAAQYSGAGVKEERQVCSFRTVRAARDQCAQWMSPNECIQYIQTVFRKGSRVVHAIDYAMQMFSPCKPARSSDEDSLSFQGQTEASRFD